MRSFSHFLCATWAIRSDCSRQMSNHERFAHARSFPLSDLSDLLTVAHLSWGDLSESLTVAHLIWAKWVNERMSNEGMSKWALSEWANSQPCWIRTRDPILQRRSWSWNNASLAITFATNFWSCGRTTSPGYCTCRGSLCWWAFKAGECTIAPLHILAGDFLSCTYLPGKENGPRLDTKLLLSALIKA